MALVETDFLLALMSEKDRLHQIFVEIAENESLLLSPFSLMELDMLRLEGKIVIEDYGGFQQDLKDLLDYYSIKILSDKPEYHLKAFILRENFGLTYFDSLHAATAIVEGALLISSDGIYSTVKGLKYLHPREWFSKT